MSPSEPQNHRVREAIDTLLKMFEEENLEKVARAVFKGTDKNVPSDNWSFLNRVLMYLHGTEDARGYKQWQESGRHVRKGAHAFYILAPVMKKVKLEEQNESESVSESKKVEKVLAGFRAVPVFGIEDTEGAPIIREEFKLDIPYEFNGIIHELGLKVVLSRFCGAAYGSYSLGAKVIRLASPDIEVFLHELSHAVDDRLHGLKPGQRNDQEVTAEFSSAVIGYLMGYRIPMGNVKEYIESYSFKELLNSLSRIEKVVSYVIERTKAPQAGVTLPGLS